VPTHGETSKELLQPHFRVKDSPYLKILDNGTITRDIAGYSFAQNIAIQILTNRSAVIYKEAAENKQMAQEGIGLQYIGNQCHQALCGWQAQLVVQ
jgi:hypothetical protein